VDERNHHKERRQSPRTRTQCNAELTATASLLDASPEDESARLVLLGQTQDISADGVALIIPSIRVHEEYCAKQRELKLSLHLPATAIEMDVTPVRSRPVDGDDPDGGSILGVRINGLGKTQENQLKNYLQFISQGAPLSRTE